MAIARTHMFGVVNFQLNEAPMAFAGSSAILWHHGERSQRNVALRRRGNAMIVPRIRAQSSASGANFYLLSLFTNTRFVFVTKLNFLFCLHLLFHRICSRFQVLQSGSDSQV